MQGKLAKRRGTKASFRSIATIFALLGLLPMSSASTGGVAFDYSTAADFSRRYLEDRAVEGSEILIDDMIFQVSKAAPLGFTPGNRWPSGRIPIQFDASLDATKRSAFLNACALWSPAGISCQLRTSEANYLQVAQRSGSECSGSDNVSCAQVGMVGGGQRIRISVNHWGILSVVAHEIGHSIGLLHEQMRPDRDRFILVHLANAQDGTSDQFNGTGGTTLSDYDFSSIMHYDPCSFARYSDCATNFAHRVIEIKDCGIYDIPRPSRTPSAMDIDSVRRLYGVSLTAPFRQSSIAEALSVPCGPSCVTRGGVRYGRVNHVEWMIPVPPIPNPLPSAEPRCRIGFKQVMLPREGLVSPETANPQGAMIIRGDCGCPNAVG